jgi:CBS domain containing-hemolysin-like protein
MKKTQTAVFSLLSLLPMTCFASGASRHLEQIIADYLVWVVILIVPVAVIYIFWKIHILPEIYAEKVHHPQTKLIQVICIMSIVFGGILWPLAWILAYSKPVLHKMAYGTDKSDDFYLDSESEHAGKPLTLAVVDDEITNLREKLHGLEEKRQIVIDQIPNQVARS